MMRRIVGPFVLPLTLLATAPSVARANDLRVENSAIERNGNSLRVTARVSWKNAWRSARNYDAVWLFVKVRGGPNAALRHARLASATATGSPAITCQITTDNVGVFCFPAAAHRGDVSSSITLELDSPTLPEALRNSPTLQATVFGIEMVYVAEGPFSIGDPDPRSVERAAYYKSNASGGHDGPLRVTSEAAITVAPNAGALYYRSTNQYEGDRGGPIPAEFPKGTRAFYAMKYEVSQGQYASYLNAISYDASPFRANIAGPRYYVDRGTIRVVDGHYVAEKPNRPANMLSWDDGCAFADWAGLRPMTELEFTKAARGPVEPVAGDYPWGTNSKAKLVRRMQADGDLLQTGDADESRLSDATKEALGASYWWIMDLAGSVWEKVITLGHPAGRAFKGTHGDGQLAEYGRASNADWPAGDYEAGGYGYRGGGHYEWERERARDPLAQELNPHSPVEWRPYGAWGGAPRSVAYGFRAVRTADPR